MEGKTIEIPLRGIVRNTPSAIGIDGEMDELVNLRHKDGAIRPVPAAKHYAYIGNYTSVFFHSNAGYKHILGVTGNKLYWFANEINGQFEPLNQDEQYICDIVGKVSFSQVGNVVNIIDEEGMKYGVWANNAYNFVKFNPLDFDLLDLQVNGATPEQEYKVLHENVSVEADSESIKGYIKKKLSQIEEDGELFGAVLAIYAFEMYDGGYVYHSAPIFLSQPNDKDTRLENITINGSQYSYKDFAFKVFYGYFETEPIGFRWEIMALRAGTYGTTPDSFPNKTTLSNTLRPNLSVDYRSAQPNIKEISVYANSNKLQYRVKKSIPESYKDIFKSVSVFITPESYFYDFESISTFLYYKNGEWSQRIFKVKDKELEDVIKELNENMNFFKVHEIPFKNINSNIGTWIDIDLKEKLGDKLVHQETLPVDSFSRNIIISENQFVYNSKLHIFDYYSQIYKGKKLPEFYATQGVGQFSAGYTNVNQLMWWIATEIKTSSGNTQVVVSKPHTGTNAETIFGLNTIISYPDRRAYRMTIFIADVYQAPTEPYDINKGSGMRKKHVFNLKPHPSQNFAYYINPTLKPISVSMSMGYLYPDWIIPEEDLPTEYFPNTLKVSQVNNPFYFSPEATYQVGSGKIIALSANTIALSTGQFGEFPLYVFCSDGVYAMFVGGGDITYSASKPVARDVVNNPRVKPIDDGVVFSTDRGLMLISGAQVRELSEVIEGEPFIYADSTKHSYIDLFQKATSNANLVELLSTLGKDFKSFSKNSEIAYNFNQKELWLTNPEESIVLAFRAGVWGKINQSASYIVSDYPRDFIFTNGNLYDIGQEDILESQVLFLTRPIKIGTQGFKQVMRAVLRANIITAENKYAGLYVFGSYDNIKYAFLGGTEKTGQIRDIGATIERVDCKFLRIGFVGKLKPESTLDFIELSVKPKLQQKIR